ncbi:facilitated trehalose transporter Tret1-like [Schistocerca nitens]|uniref:facilitated trehalose transporter Tret1-like n=1 Tax=Schistocerca nitens TaxID=7011 RepID=UPI002119274A|nr:facilitated trehalose transporter Tret1-like [Schistocerca nitens]
MLTLDITKIEGSFNVQNAKNNSAELKDVKPLLPQIIITGLCCLLLFDLGMMISFTRMTPTLYEKLSVDVIDASWLGITTYIMLALGSCISGLTADAGGRRVAMILANSASLSGWIATGLCNSTEVLYVSSALTGLAVGFTMTPVLAYLGEISQPQFRSMLIAATGTMPHIGCLLIYSLWPYVHWKWIAFASVVVPVISVLSILWIPESPFWLMAKGQEKKAEASMEWLRGSLAHHKMNEEMTEVQQHVASDDRAVCILYEPQKFNVRHDNLGLDLSPGESVPKSVAENRCSSERGCGGADSVRVKFVDCKEKQVQSDSTSHKSRKCLKGETLCPQIVLSGYFFFTRLSGASNTATYFRSFIHAFGLQFNIQWVLVYASLLGFISISIFTVLLKKFGKRELALTSIVVCCICNIALGTCVNVFENNYAGVRYRMDCNSVTFADTKSGSLGMSYTVDEPNATDANIDHVGETGNFKENGTRFTILKSNGTDICSSAVTVDNVLQLPVTGIALVAFTLLLFSRYIGVYEIPWIYGAELFPVRSRGIALGAAAAIAYSASFISEQIYPYLTYALGVKGTFWLHGFMGLIAFIHIYCLLPETDGKPIDETESIFKRMLEKHAEKRLSTKR